MEIKQFSYFFFSSARRCFVGRNNESTCKCMVFSWMNFDTLNEKCNGKVPFVEKKSFPAIYKLKTAKSLSSFLFLPLQNCSLLWTSLFDVNWSEWMDREQSFSISPAKFLFFWYRKVLIKHCSVCHEQLTFISEWVLWALSVKFIGRKVKQKRFLQLHTPAVKRMQEVNCRTRNCSFIKKCCLWEKEKNNIR